jgi:hypothetical protein
MTEGEVPCPFCGRDVWFGSDDGPCEHLLADWANDPYDNGGGVLGSMIEQPNEGFPDAEELAVVTLTLCAWVWSDGEEQVRARLKLAADALEGEKPAWWGDLHVTILRLDNPEAFEDWDPEFMVPDHYASNEALAEFADPMAEAIVRKIPGITVTYKLLGGMTSGTSTFVWSDDPAAGRAAIDAAVPSAIKTIEQVIAELDATHS